MMAGCLAIVYVSCLIGFYLYENPEIDFIHELFHVAD